MEASHAWNKSFRLAVYFGFCPCSMVARSFVSKKKSWAYSILLKIIFGCAVAGLLYEIIRRPVKTLRQAVTLVFVPQAYLVASCFSFYIHWNEEEFLKLLQKMKESDRMFGQLKRKPPKHVSIAPGLTIVAINLVLTLRAFLSWTFLEVITVFYANMAILISVQPFISILSNLTSRLVLLKKVLVAVSRKRGLNAPRKSEEMAKILKLHNLLCSICEDLNSLFSMQLLYIFFEGIVLIAWHSFRVRYSITEHENVLLVASKVLPVINITFLSVCITTVCRQASIEANAFSSLVYHLMINDDNDVIINRKLLFHMLMKKKLEFTACGFFTLDYTLLQAMLATSATYIVLLLQYK